MSQEIEQLNNAERKSVEDVARRSLEPSRLIDEALSQLASPAPADRAMQFMRQIAPQSGGHSPNSHLDSLPLLKLLGPGDVTAPDASPPHEASKALRDTVRMALEGDGVPKGLPDVMRRALEGDGAPKGLPDIMRKALGDKNDEASKGLPDILRKALEGDGAKQEGRALMLRWLQQHEKKSGDGLLDLPPIKDKA